MSEEPRIEPFELWTAMMCTQERQRLEAYVTARESDADRQHQQSQILAISLNWTGPLSEREVNSAEIGAWVEDASGARRELSRIPYKAIDRPGSSVTVPVPNSPVAPAGRFGIFIELPEGQRFEVGRHATATVTMGRLVEES